MLKRTQILLTDWLVEYVKYFCGRYDLSFSEIVRLIMCMEIGSWICTKYPKYRFGVTNQDIAKALLKAEKNKELVEKDHQLMSKIYFETRKAIEYFMKQEKKRKK